jgi:hypothetical protein
MEWGHQVERVERGSNVSCVTIPELIETSGYKRVSILKVDIEGAELELFKHNTDWLELVDNLVIELHGEECSEVFFRAIKEKEFKIIYSGELTVCLQP